MAIAASYPALRPSLLLDFANAKAVDPRVTFTRSTTAKYYDGVTTAKAEENLVFPSLVSTFATTLWYANGTATATPNNAVAPDGTTTATTISTTGAGGARYSKAYPAGTYTVSCWVRSVSGDTSFQTDFENGNVGSLVLTSSWQRHVSTQTLSATRNWIDFQIAGTGVFEIWGVQLEQRDAVTAYTPTTTQPITNYIPVLQTAAAGVPRIDHNPVTGECLGLLIEEQRTNLLRWSESFRTQTLAVTGVSGTFVDGETVTATGGGTGIYVLAESTGSSFAIFNGSGTFTGTLTGGTSGATATISSSVANWAAVNATVTANTVVAPDGTLTGDKLVEDTSNGNHDVYQNVSVTPITYASSYFLKAGERTKVAFRNGAANVGVFDLTTGVFDSLTGLSSPEVKNVGNGWWRVSFVRVNTDTATRSFGVYLLDGSGNASYTGDGYSGIYIWGAQLEAGAFPTSYIPTVATQETRNADAATMTGTNFSSWFNNGEGTLYANCSSFNTASGNVGAVSIDDTTTNNRMEVRYSGTTPTTSRFVAVAGNSTQADITNGTGLGSERKLISSYELNDYVFTVDGTAVQVDTTGTIPVVSRLLIGDATFGSKLNGHIKKLSYYPQRLTNANLQALTA